MRIFKKAVLLIHGIAGGIFDLEELQRSLELNYNFDTYSYTLKGHDDYYEFDHLTYKDWLKQSDDMIKFLLDNGYTKIYVIGHSMGGVIASYLASKYKEITKVVLLSPAFKYMVFKDNNLDIVSSLKKLPNILDGYSKKQLISRFTKFPVSVSKEFIKLIDNCYDCIKKVKVPILIIHGNDDLIAPIESSVYAYNSCLSNCKILEKISGVNHSILKNKKKNMIISDINNFLLHNIKSKNIVDK